MIYVFLFCINKYSVFLSQDTYFFEEIKMLKQPVISNATYYFWQFR